MAFQKMQKDVKSKNDLQSKVFIFNKHEYSTDRDCTQHCVYASVWDVCIYICIYGVCMRINSSRF